jgi:spindle assembly abnormal protein 6
LGKKKLLPLFQVLRVQLTSEPDPFFVHTLEVSEEDFQTLKVEQCILVDFATFPSKFIELLEKCIEAKKQTSPR